MSTRLPRRVLASCLRHTHRALALVSAFTMLLVLSTALPATSATSPQDPPFTIPLSTLRAAVKCDALVHPGTTHETVLLVHGTGGTPDEYWSWNWERALPAAGFGVCTVALPQRATVAVPISAEYVAYAAKRAYALSGRKIAILGHSQGGTLAVWVAKYWPSVARTTTDVISLDGGFRGSPIGDTACLLKMCSAIDWESMQGSHFVKALRNKPLPLGPAFTGLWSTSDELLIGNPEGSVIPGATNMPIQALCPHHVADHITVVIDSASYALILDALTHAGPAKLSRITGVNAICNSLFMPHFDVTTAPKGLGTLAAFILALTTNPIGAEPPLPAYAAPYGR